jgi:hypothetical protein
MKKIPPSLLFLIIFCIIISSTTHVQTYADKTVLTCEFYNREEIRTRLTWAYHDMKLLLIEKASDFEKLTLTAGFSSPLFTAGPVNKYGLFRQMNNPMGFSVGSSVFREKSDLSLSCSFYTGQKRFYFFEPLPDVIGLFLAETEGRPLLWGGILSIDLGEYCFAEFLLSGSQPAPDSCPDTWFAEKNQFPGGRLGHIGAKLCINPDTFCFSITEIISGGQFILPGSFTHCALSWKTAYVTPELYIGLCTDEYITPEADYEDTGLKTGGRVTVTPAQFLSLFAGYELVQNHPEPLTAGFLQAEETCKAGAEFIIPITGKSSLFLASNVKKRFIYDDDGHDTEEIKAVFSGEFESESFTLKAGIYFTGQEESFETAFKGSISLSTNMHYFLIGGCFFTGDEMSWSAHCEYVFATTTFNMYMKLFTPGPLSTDTDLVEQCLADPFSSLSFTVGCEIAY